VTNRHNGNKVSGDYKLLLFILRCYVYEHTLHHQYHCEYIETYSMPKQVFLLASIPYHGKLKYVFLSRRMFFDSV